MSELDDHAGRHRAERRVVPWHRWPRQIYRWDEDYFAFAARQFGLVFVLIAGSAAAGGVGALLAPAIGHSRESGFWGGMLTIGIAFVALVLIAVIGALAGRTDSLGARFFAWLEGSARTPPADTNKRPNG